ncbi:MAG: polyphosphate polymerase domain-containing protein [Clostridia bacterium]|nr:polyphosphate polymerase domain-containing protein [Clostridia bacterium]
MEIIYRNEVKHVINAGDKAAICASMRAVAKPDPHAGPDGCYKVRSLYFDTPSDSALREKLDGVNEREKFRIRYYNDDPSVIHLEKKVKKNGLGHKVSADLTAEEAQRIVDGDLGWMPASGRALVVELYSKMKSQCLHPKTIVDYVRTPFVCGPGNVRVTIDENIRTGLRCTDFLNPSCITIPAGEPVMVLEVKWDEYLPAVIQHAVQLKNRRASAFSKYRISRIYD